MLTVLAVASLVFIADKQLPIHDLIIEKVVSNGDHPIIKGTFRLGLTKDAGKDWYQKKLATAYFAPPSNGVFNPSWTWVNANSKPDFYIGIANVGDSDPDPANGRDVGEGSEISFEIQAPSKTFASAGCLYIGIEGKGYHNYHETSFVSTLYASRMVTGSPQEIFRYIQASEPKKQKGKEVIKTDTVVPINLVKPADRRAKKIHGVHMLQNWIWSPKGYFVSPGTPPTLGTADWLPLNLEADTNQAYNHTVKIDPDAVGYFIVVTRGITSSLSAGAPNFHDESSGIIRQP